MNQMIPLSVPNICGNESKYVQESLDTGWVSTAGKFVDKFEKAVSDYTGAEFSVACQNGTAALHLALLSVGVSKGDEVIAPTVTFIAPINAITYVDAKPIFMDCDDLFNIDETKTIDFLNNHTISKDGYTYNKASNNRISAIILVHIFGNPSSSSNLIELCRKRNIKVIEDCAESIGSFNLDPISGKRVHTGLAGDVGCFSFNGNKIITCGGGGLLLSNNYDVAEKARYLSTQAKDDEIFYEHGEIGYNYRLTNVAAAIGLAQLELLEKFIHTKKENYEMYREKLLESKNIRLLGLADNTRPNYWFYTIQIQNDKEIELKSAIEALHKRNIQTRPIWKLNHTQKMFLGCETYNIEKAPLLTANALNIPCSSNLSKEEVNYIANTLIDIFG